MSAFNSASVAERHCAGFISCANAPAATDINKTMASSLLIFDLVSVKMHNPPLQRRGCGLRSVAHPQLAENAIDMRLHGCLGDEQVSGNLLVAAAAHNQLQ